MIVFSNCSIDVTDVTEWLYNPNLERDFRLNMEISQERSSFGKGDGEVASKGRHTNMLAGVVELSTAYSEVARALMAFQKKTPEEFLTAAVKEYVKLLIGNPELLYGNFRTVKKILEEEDKETERNSIIDP